MSEIVLRDWGQFAVLLIDVQKDFWGEKTVERFPHFPSNVTRLLKLCRSEGIEVIHLRARFSPDMAAVNAPTRGDIGAAGSAIAGRTLPRYPATGVDSSHRPNSV